MKRAVAYVRVSTAGKTRQGGALGLPGRTPSSMRTARDPWPDHHHCGRADRSDGRGSGVGRGHFSAAPATVPS